MERRRIKVKKKTALKHTKKETMGTTNRTKQKAFSDVVVVAVNVCIRMFFLLRSSCSKKRN